MLAYLSCLANNHGQLRLYQGCDSVSALQVACILYVGVQLLQPGQDAGIDFAQEYELAKGMAGCLARSSPIQRTVS
jgi:hypothetical protein